MDSSLASLSKMKVADLKKELKNRNLAITGNKTELVERLQVALVKKTKKPLGGTTINTSVGEDDFDEDEILGSNVDDGTKMTAQEEAAVLGGAGKKVGQAPRLSIKRSAPAGAVNGVAKGSVNKENVEESPAKAAKLDDDALDARTKRFGIASSEGSKKAARVARFGEEVANESATPGTPDLDKLKQRADRFGEVTSKSLTKLEVEEKKKLRMERFGMTPEQKSKTDTDEAKIARAARFATETPTPKVVTDLKDTASEVTTPLKSGRTPIVF